jgi:CheY-like chemotaxis protein
MNRTSILLVEDDENDIFLLKHSFQEAGIHNRLDVTTDGLEAISFLSGHGQYADRQLWPMPSLILLDLKLPRKSGLEVLQWLREEAKLDWLPVIVFTSSLQRADIENSYRLGANSFVVKPSDIDARIKLASLIKEYWLGFNESL